MVITPLNFRNIRIIRKTFKSCAEYPENCPTSLHAIPRQIKPGISGKSGISGKFIRPCPEYPKNLVIQVRNIPDTPDFSDIPDIPIFRIFWIFRIFQIFRIFPIIRIFLIFQIIFWMTKTHSRAIMFKHFLSITLTMHHTGP